MSRMEKGDKKQIELETPAEAADSASVGAMLRQLRREKGLSIRDVVMETNISASNLVAMEHENYQDLPADTFLRGQVAIYARQLGIDGPATAKAFLRQRDALAGEKKKSRLGNFSTAKKLAEPAHLSSAGLAGLLLIIIIISIAGFSYYTGWNPFGYLLKREEPPSAHHLPAAAAALVEPAETAAPAPEAAAEPQAAAVPQSSSEAQEKPRQDEAADSTAPAQQSPKPNAVTGN